MAIYMQFPGAHGSVIEPGFEGWIELDSLALGMDRPTDSRSGSSGMPAIGKLQIHNLMVTKPTDGASPALTIAALQGAFNKTVKIVFTLSTEHSKFLSYELDNCGIASAHTTGGKEGKPTESYSLSFSKIIFTFDNTDQSGNSSPTITGYDLATARSI